MTDKICTSFIDGAYVPVNGAPLLPVINPATEEILCYLQEADADEVHQAIASARRAFPAWAGLSTDSRNDILYAVHDALKAHAEELTLLEAQTTGLPIGTIGWLVARAAQNFRAFAEFASTLSGETYAQNSDYLTYVTREAKGVAAMISPWNAPLALSSMRMATCIAFGNCCVIKPSEFTPLSVLRMVEIMHEAGLPKGVVNIVNGRGPITGQSLTNHADIDMIGFTGGTETGRAIMSNAGKALKPALVELGGKSASIVTQDADLDLALDGTLMGIYSSNGQQCLGGSRILVQRSIADDFIAKFVARAESIRVGDPMDPQTEMGPLLYKAHQERVLNYIHIARSEGAKILTGDQPLPDLPKGYYVRPIAVLAKSNADRVCQEEIFGPFATFLIYDDLNEAIAIANESDFGLAAYVWTQSLDTAMQCSRRIQTGTVWINTPVMRELRAPFGGIKDSGIGHDGARASADFFTHMKTTSIPINSLAIRKLGA